MTSCPKYPYSGHVFIPIFTATLLATTAIEPDCDLEQMRAWIERFKEDEEEEVPAQTATLSNASIKLVSLYQLGTRICHVAWQHA